MTLMTDGVLERVNARMTTGIRLYPIAPAQKAAFDEGAFFLTGLGDSAALSVPDWVALPHEHGFGGWQISRGGQVYFLRPRLTHTGADALLLQIAALARELRGVNLKTPEMASLIQDSLPPEGFRLQDLEDQTADIVEAFLLSLGDVTSEDGERQIQAGLRRAFSAWIERLPACRPRPEDPREDHVRFLEWQIKVGSPEQAPGGLEEAFRDAYVSYLSQTPVASPCNGRRGRCAVDCTGKTDPGDWVTVIPDRVIRDTPVGPEDRDDLDVPLMIAAQCPIGYNRKRTPREGNALKKGWELMDPRPFEHCLLNGYEYALGGDLQRKMTEVVVAYLAVRDVNLYTDPTDGGDLNLDDILVTPRGHTALKTRYRRRHDFSLSQWERNAGRFLQADGRPREGHDVTFPLRRASSVARQDVFGMTVRVEEPAVPDPHTVGKVLIDGTHKAMAKRLSHDLVGVDRRGRRFPIDVVISGASIKEKKIPTLPLAAAASRAGIRYIETFETPIHPDRSRWAGAGDYLTWALGQEDLVAETARTLTVQGESPDGRIDVYALVPTGQEGADGPCREEWVGRAVVGWNRASRNWETEETSNKVRGERAVSLQLPILGLTGVNFERDPTDMAAFNAFQAQYHALRPFATVGSSGGAFEEAYEDNEED